MVVSKVSPASGISAVPTALTPNTVFDEGPSRAASDPRGGTAAGTTEDGLIPDVYHRDGPDRRERRQLHGISLRTRTAGACWPEPRRGAAINHRLLRPRDRPDALLRPAPGCPAGDGPRAGTTDKISQLRRCSRRRHHHAGNACPLSDGAAALVIM